MMLPPADRCRPRDLVPGVAAGVPADQAGARPGTRRLVIQVALLAAVLATPAAAQAPRVDPLLRALARPEHRQALALAPRLEPGAPGAPARGQPMGGLVALDRGPGGETRVGVLVRVRTPRALAALRTAGAEIGSVHAGIATARVPLDGLPALLSAPELDVVEAARVATVSHDSSMRVIRVDGLRQWAEGDWVGRAGHGVIIGIYDTGLDLAHGDFQDAAGRTRLLGLWDQTATGTGVSPPEPFTYGAYCPPASLEDGICSQRDLNGHGTHVAGTAAGNGLDVGTGGTARRYAGVAPAADLLIVKGGDGTFAFDRIVDGVRWLFAEAERLGRPIVVNLSLGATAGPHDGTTLFEQALDSLVGPGRVLVVSAGNEGSNGNTVPLLPPAYRHATAVPVAGATRDFVIEVPAYTPSPGTCNDVLGVELWHEAEDHLDVTVRRPDGSSVTAAHGQVELEDASAGRIHIDNASGGPNPENQDHQVWIQLSDCGTSGPPAAGSWTVSVRATMAASGMPYHLWITQTEVAAHGVAGFDNAYVIRTPGTARRAVTVGAFVSRHCWPTATTTLCNAQREELGDIAWLSSGGPTRDGRLKPEIAAPGRMVISARSRDGAFIASRTAPDGVHWALDGTSMAAPHVSGAVALLLQRKPDLTPEDVKAILARTAARDAFTSRSYTGEPPGTPNNQWGYGKLDVRAALEDLGPLDVVASVVVTPAEDTLWAGDTRPITAQVLDAFGRPVQVPILWVSRNPTVASVDTAGVVTALAPGASDILAVADGVVGIARVHVALPATLAIEVEPAAPTGAASSARGQRIPLLRVRLRAAGAEPVALRALGFELRGNDPAARALLVADENGNGAADPAEPVVAAADVVLTPQAAARVVLKPGDVQVPRDGERALVLAVELSGAVPNGSAFEATFLAAETRGEGALSGRPGELTQPETVASGPTRTTLLRADEVFALSENPVRSGRVIFNFASRPRVAAVYTLDGRLVADLLARMDGDGRVEWDLRNDAGSRVAAGVYLVVFDVGGRIVREKLFVTRPAGAP